MTPSDNKASRDTANTTNAAQAMHGLQEGEIKSGAGNGSGKAVNNRKRAVVFEGSQARQERVEPPRAQRKQG
jgi:Family of unknown function (DUF6496)